VSTTIRVSTETRDRIASLADSSGQPMNAVVEEALDALERRRFFAAFNARYRELRQDEATWNGVEVERAVEAGPLRDGSG
jgi:predicted transcriptional regulator